MGGGGRCRSTRGGAVAHDMCGWRWTEIGGTWRFCHQEEGRVKGWKRKSRGIYVAGGILTHKIISGVIGSFGRILIAFHLTLDPRGASCRSSDEISMIFFNTPIYVEYNMLIFIQDFIKLTMGLNQ